MDKIKLTLIFSLFLLGCNLCLAQDGNLDLSFDPGSGTSGNGDINTTSIQSDGKIIIGGIFIVYNGTSINRIARLNTNGSLDTSFNPGTGADGSLDATSIQSDGKIIIAGHFTTYNGTSRNRVARLNTNGSLDLSFNPGTGADLWVNTTSIQIDGKIIIGGIFSAYNGTARNKIARLNSNGSLDLSFDPGNGANDVIFATSIQSDGKIIIGGDFDSYNGVARKYLTRLNSNGSIDLSFNTGTGADSAVYATSVQGDGKIIIGGDFTTYNGTARNRIARLNSNGSLDVTFNPGIGVKWGVWATAIQSDGKIIIAGEFDSCGGISRNDIARLNTDGSLDTTFDPGLGTDGSIFATSIQSDGKIIIAGNFNHYDGSARYNIARLNTTISGIHQWSEEIKKVYIFPNPLSHTSTLKSEVELKNAVLTLYNSFGQLVKKEENVSGLTCILNRYNLPAGVYYLSLSQGNQIIASEKLVISK